MQEISERHLGSQPVLTHLFALTLPPGSSHPYRVEIKCVSLGQVAALAGHTKLDVTERYTVLSMKDLEKAVERMSWE